ncbi:MAG: wyosine [tRNA(Phe)-imidazoG37] synthetase (radical SAM superfamily) [Clostridium sp.]|jgi:wyosine [tRNA(Phe)-imidazoG37] synthetase (radical SAM superfamily)
MNESKFVYGPVPSRRMGESLGISPIPKKTCNYSCIYCQLGRTDKLSNKRIEFFDISDIIVEFKTYLESGIEFDVVTIVGEGEPTLYLKLGELIGKIKELTSKPVAVITNGALLHDKTVRNELCEADIVLPSFDAYDEDTFKRINRPYPKLTFMECYNGLVEFSNIYKGQLWLEIMLIDGINDDSGSLQKLKSMIKKIKYDRLYINTPARPPAEEFVKTVSNENMKMAIEMLGGISIENLVSVGFSSGIKDDYAAILSIIKRHPMNQFEIKSFLNSRKCEEIDNIIERLNQDNIINHIDYKGFITYRLK